MHSFMLTCVKLTTHETPTAPGMASVDRRSVCMLCLRAGHSLHCLATPFDRTERIHQRSNHPPPHHSHISPTPQLLHNSAYCFGRCPLPGATSSTARQRAERHRHVPPRRRGTQQSTHHMRSNFRHIDLESVEPTGLAVVRRHDDTTRSVTLHHCSIHTNG